MAKLLFEIVTAERLVSSQEVDVVVAPGEAGELAVLPRHAPLLTSLRSGEIMVRNEGEESYIAVGGGFMEVMPGKVTILADTAERADEIDEQRAEEALSRAQEQVDVSSSGMDLERALASMRRSQAEAKGRATPQVSGRYGRTPALTLSDRGEENGRVILSAPCPDTQSLNSRSRDYR